MITGIKQTGVIVENFSMGSVRPVYNVTQSEIMGISQALSVASMITGHTWGWYYFGSTTRYCFESFTGKPFSVPNGELYAGESSEDLS